MLAAADGVTLVPPSDLSLPKSVLTFILLIGAVIIAVATGRLVEYCVRRRPIGDDVSDISEYTRELLKQQVLFTFGRAALKKGAKQTADQLARKFANRWRENIARRKVERARALKAYRTTHQANGPAGTGERRHSKVSMPTASVLHVSETNQPDSRKGSARPIPTVVIDLAPVDSHPDRTLTALDSSSDA